MKVLNTISTVIVTAYFAKKLLTDSKSVPGEVAPKTNQGDEFSLDNLHVELRERLQALKTEIEEHLGKQITLDDFLNILREHGVNVDNLLES